MKEQNQPLSCWTSVNELPDSEDPPSILEVCVHTFTTNNVGANLRFAFVSEML
jgi:hypothetical protein